MHAAEKATAGSIFIHASAIVDEGAVVGPGTKIWHWVHVTAGARIGDNCVLGQNVYAGNVRIGNNVKIQNNVSVYDGVVLEDDVFCGPSMVFTNVINPRSHVERKHEFRRTVVRRGATLGANCVIVCGVTIGACAMVGAGAVVTRSIPDYALVVGNPARHSGWVCDCGVRLKQTAAESVAWACSECGTRFHVQNGQCSVAGAVNAG